MMISKPGCFAVSSQAVSLNIHKPLNRTASRFGLEDAVPVASIASEAATVTDTPKVLETGTLATSSETKPPSPAALILPPETKLLLPGDVEWIRMRKSLKGRVCPLTVLLSGLFALPRFAVIEPAKLLAKGADKLYGLLEDFAAWDGMLLYREDESAGWHKEGVKKYDPRDETGQPYDKYVWSPIPGAA